MASDFHTLHFQTIKTSGHSIKFHLTSPSVSFPFLKHQYQYQQQQQLSYLSTYPSKPISHKSKIYPLLIASSSFSPPTSKEEAILQAKTLLSTALDKPLNNAKLAGKFKKLKQPRFRVEIPVVDDESPELGLQIFGDMAVKRKGSAIKILIIWPNLTLKEAGIKSFGSYSKNTVEHMDILSAKNRNLGCNDIAVFVAPESSQVSVIKEVTDGFYPRPVAILNPRWGFDEEGRLGEVRGFVGSFEVVYSFTGLEVRGMISRRRGVIFTCGGEEWSVWVEEEEQAGGAGDLKLVSRFKARPSLVEVENVLYNLMAINSPFTKSVKFLRDIIVSNVTAKTKN